MSKDKSIEKKKFVSIDKDGQGHVIKFDATDNAVKLADKGKEISGNLSNVSDNLTKFSSDAVALGNIAKDFYQIRFQIKQIEFLEQKSEETHEEIMAEIKNDYKKFVENLDAETQKYLKSIEAHIHKFDIKFKDFDINRTMEMLDKIIDKIINFNIENLDERKQRALDQLHDRCDTLMNKIFEI